jgi:hypothetical protein
MTLYCPSKFITIFSSLFILSSTTDVPSFGSSAVSFLNCIRMERQYLTEGLGLCQKINLSPDVFVDYNFRGTTDVTKISLLLASSNDRCLYSLCPVLLSQSHFEIRNYSYEMLTKTISVAFFQP